MAIRHPFVYQHRSCCATLCLTLPPWHCRVSCPPKAYYPGKSPRHPTGPLLCRRQTSSIASASRYSTLWVLQHFPRDGYLLGVAAPLCHPHALHTNRRLGNRNVRTVRNPTLSRMKHVVPRGVSASRCCPEPVFENFHSVRAAAEWQHRVIPSVSSGGAETLIQSAALPRSSYPWRQDDAARGKANIEQDSHQSASAQTFCYFLAVSGPGQRECRADNREIKSSTLELQKAQLLSVTPILNVAIYTKESTDQVVPNSPVTLSYSAPKIPIAETIL